MTLFINILIGAILGHCAIIFYLADHTFEVVLLLLCCIAFLIRITCLDPLNRVLLAKVGKKGVGRGCGNRLSLF